MKITDQALLTQAEVDALPDGTLLVIVWSGGNGPHTYSTKNHNGVIYAFSSGIQVAPIEYVGKYPATQVWLRATEAK